MFSQLTALAKSATDFSLDNLQDKEEGDVIATPIPEEKVTLPEKSVPATTELPGKSPVKETKNEAKSSALSISASSFTNLFNSTSSNTDNKSVTQPETSSSQSISSSFNQLLDYRLTGKSSTNNASSNSSILGEANNVPTEGKHQNDSKASLSTEDDTLKYRKQHDTSSVDPTPETTLTFTLKDESKQNIDPVVKSPTKSKKGSGREAAKLLEMQLRGTVADLEANLKEKIDQLADVNSCRKREKDDFDKLQCEIVAQKSVISELEESNIEITNLNEELEQEVIALRQEVALNKQYNQEKSKQESKIIDGSNQVTDNFSIKTEQSTVSDVDSESEVDRLRASLQDLQQALSSQTKKHKAQFNSAEKKAKAKLLSSEQKIESLVAEIDNLNTKLSSQTADVEAERDSHGTILSEIEEKFRTRLAKLEEENHSLEQSLEQLSEDKQLLEEALNKTVLEKNSLEKSMDQRIRDVMDETSGEATTKEVQLVELRDQCSDLQSSLSASEAKYIELKEKFASFTEKTKIQVKKFIESQKAAEEEKRQVAATLEARESEVTSLRLKLETVDHSLSDRKALSSELAERYSELQRDMQRKLDELTSKDAHAEDLQRRILHQEEQISSLQSQLSKAEAVLVDARQEAVKEATELRESFAITLQTEQANWERQKHACDALVVKAEQRLTSAVEECDSLRREVAVLQDQVEKGVGNKKTLEDYKSRAQKAVKQANSTSAALSAKLTLAEESLEAFEVRVRDAETEREELRRVLLVAEETLASERQKHAEQVDTIESKSFDLQSEVLSLKASLDTAIAESEKLKARQEQLTYLLDERSSAQQEGKIYNKQSPNKVVKSSSNNTAVVVPVRRVPSSSSTASSKQNTKAEPLSSQHMDYSSNTDSDCVLVKGKTMDYVDVDVNAQSDLENGGDVSENSSVVVQWNNIMHRTNTGTDSTNSPNSDCDTTSPKSASRVKTAKTASVCNNEIGVPKVESSLTIASCSSENSMGGDDDSDMFESSMSEGNKGRSDYFFVNELKKELHRLRQEISSCHMVAEELRRDSSVAKEERSKAVQDYNELKAFHERTKKLLSSPDSATNIEYLKKCVYRLMVTKQISERSRLYPVISTLLKFTPVETREVNAAIQEEVAASEYTIGSSASWLSASSTIGGLFGGGGAIHGTVTSTGEVVSEEVDVASSTTTSAGSSSWW